MDMIEITDSYEIGLFDNPSNSPAQPEYRQISVNEYMSELNRFDDYAVHFDGSQWVATLVGENKSGERRLPYKSEYDGIFDLLYNESLHLFGSKQNTARFEYIFNALKDDYAYSDGQGIMPLDKYVAYRLRCKTASLNALFRRFRYKSGFIKWTHFITVTYSDKIFSSECEFARSLLRQFNNLHDRHGWLVAGKFERGKKTGRLHFHALIYVPPGGMVGKFIQKRDYSMEDHCMKTANVNTYFLKRYGRNDFEDVSGESEQSITNRILYIMKYIQKDGGKMFYSRGMSVTKIMRLCRASDICCTVIYNHKRIIKSYVVFRDVIERHDTDIERTKKRLI